MIQKSPQWLLQRKELCYEEEVCCSRRQRLRISTLARRFGFDAHLRRLCRFLSPAFTGIGRPAARHAPSRARLWRSWSSPGLPPRPASAPAEIPSRLAPSSLVPQLGFLGARRLRSARSSAQSSIAPRRRAMLRSRCRRFPSRRARPMRPRLPRHRALPDPAAIRGIGARANKDTSRPFAPARSAGRP